MHKVKALETQGKLKIPALSEAIPCAKHGAIAAKGIALTTYARKSDRANALSVGFDQHFRKPFDIDELIRMVACLIQKVQ